MSTAIIRDLFCKACGINQPPSNLESMVTHLMNFCRIYGFSWQITHIHLNYSCIILPPSNAWIIEEPGSTPREAVMRAVATAHELMQKSSLSTVLGGNFKKRDDNESNKPTNR